MSASSQVDWEGLREALSQSGQASLSLNQVQAFGNGETSALEDSIHSAKALLDLLKTAPVELQAAGQPLAEVLTRPDFCSLLASSANLSSGGVLALYGEALEFCRQALHDWGKQQNLPNRYLQDGEGWHCWDKAYPAWKIWGRLHFRLILLSGIIAIFGLGALIIGMALIPLDVKGRIAFAAPEAIILPGSYDLAEFEALPIQWEARADGHWQTLQISWSSSNESVDFSSAKAIWIGFNLPWGRWIEWDHVTLWDTQGQTLRVFDFSDSEREDWEHNTQPLDWYRLHSQGLATLQKEGWPSEVLSALASLQERTFKSKAEFHQALEQAWPPLDWQQRRLLRRQFLWPVYRQQGLGQRQWWRLPVNSLAGVRHIEIRLRFASTWGF